MVNLDGSVIEMFLQCWRYAAHLQVFLADATLDNVLQISCDSVTADLVYTYLLHYCRTTLSQLACIIIFHTQPVSQTACVPVGHLSKAAELKWNEFH